MPLDTRLTKIAADPAARASAAAFAQSLTATSELTAEEQKKADEFEAFVEAMFLMSLSDGVVGKDELQQLSGSIAAILDLEERETGKRTELAHPIVKLKEILDKLGKLYGTDGFGGRVAAIAQRMTTDDARKYCYRLAAGVVFVDDYVAGGEISALDDLAEALGLTGDQTTVILREVHDALLG